MVLGHSAPQPNQIFDSFSCWGEREGGWRREVRPEKEAIRRIVDKYNKNDAFLRAYHKAKSKKIVYSVLQRRNLFST